MPSVAESILAPGAAMARLPKVATPFTAAMVIVFPPLEKLPVFSVSVTVEESAVAMLPHPSSSETATAGLYVLPVVMFVGWVVKTRLFAGPGAMVNEAETAGV